MKLEYSIYEMLQPFCLTGTRIGTTDLICAIRLVVEQPSRIHAVQKEVYMVIAEQRHCHWHAVESSIRRSLDEAWRHNRSYMQLLANQLLHQCPSASGFIFLCAGHLLRKQMTENTLQV